ncbi:MAG: hypothetical protein OFPI_33740 [Osedax symbiont Rs2]|nr:MAG: hypothetical protein OFPI_33740 [Osedax symbiont Rs2]
MDGGIKGKTAMVIDVQRVFQPVPQPKLHLHEVLNDEKYFSSIFSDAHLNNQLRF